MSMTDPAPAYACGNIAMVGDLIEFGTRHVRLLVTFIDEETIDWTMSCGGRQFDSRNLSLMKLIARHGSSEREVKLEKALNAVLDEVGSSTKANKIAIEALI